MSAFRRRELEVAGFVAWTRWGDFDQEAVPRVQGIYIVYRDTLDPPVFLYHSTGGHFKGRDPTVSLAVLQANWVPGASVINIGMASLSRWTSLRTRLSAYRRFGSGGDVGHRGGRYIWQLVDAEDLLVAWKGTEADPADEEANLIAAFLREYGKRPFANLNSGRRRPALTAPKAGLPAAAVSPVEDGPGMFVIAGKSIQLSQEEVRRALRHVVPEPIYIWAVDVDGVLFPVVQALEVATGIHRAETRSARARDVLGRLGFSLVRT